jgi:aldehyde:ferredoxin oxidoreductase
VEGQVSYNIASQDWSTVGDSLAICRFVGERGFGADYHAAVTELLHLITGWDVDAGELQTIGSRIWNTERVVSACRGMSRRDDALPWRTTHEPIPSGPAAGRLCREETLNALLDRYYEKRGWDQHGVPTERVLKELGITTPATAALPRR